MALVYTIETELEADGRWIAEVVEIPGALVYGKTESEARNNAQALALRVVADQLEHGESATLVDVTFSAA